MALGSRRQQKKQEQAIEDAYNKRQKTIEEAEALALFATTENQGISESASIDLSLDDEYVDGSITDIGGLYL